MAPGETEVNALIRDVEALLEPGERTLWVGRPLTGFRFNRGDVFLIPFSLLWGGFAILWEYMAIRMALISGNAGAIIGPLFGIPFVAIGVYLIIGRYLQDSRRRKHTILLVTDKRLIAKGRHGHVAWDLADLTEVRLKDRKNGVGDIQIESSKSPIKEIPPGKRLRPIGMASSPLEMIPNVREPFEILMAARQKAIDRTTISREQAPGGA